MRVDTVRVRPDRSELIAHHAFPLDEFQIEAIDALDSGASVLVAAPTGSGKTVVAEYAIAAALADGKRAFYTAPIKALSNQKFQDLSRIHGPGSVGLLTGDNAINGDAPAVVMTTEVLRNMIYARSRALDDLAFVVLDEVHFLQDTYRGPVWEEVIVHLPPEVRLVCLSATVSNADELAAWITTVRGETIAVVEHKRPVRLDNLYLVGDRTAERLHLLPTIVGNRPNPEASRLDHEAMRQWKGGQSRSRIRRKLYTPARLEVVERLNVEDMLPAIYFIFSRNACSDAAKSCLAAGVKLTSVDERIRIREIVESRLAGMEDNDLAVLGYGQFLAQLEAGIAAHHAGMVPPFKEVVEACFTEGLVKVVFATETLAVGINMPARTVVIEKLSKFTGDHHAFLTPGEYTQLTGRAGRRGIDDLGHAVVLWSPFVPFDQVAALASSRSFHLNSAFRPTYNMAANLVRSYTSEQAHHLLNLSFAQYQADREVVRLETRLERRQAQLEELRQAAASPYGDIDAYRAALAPKRDRAAERAVVTGGGAAVEHALGRIRPGDVLYIEKGRYAGRVAVLTVANRKGSLKLQAITTQRTTVALSPPDFPEPPRVLGHVELPTPFAPNRQSFQREVVRALERVRLGPRDERRREQYEHEAAGGHGHAVERDPDLAERLVAAAQAERLGRDVDDLKLRVKGRSQSIARQFDRVLRILEGWGYVDGWQLTDAGECLARTFHESDLLVVECLTEGLLDDLEPAALAGLVSVFTYEHRSAEPAPPPWFPSPMVRKRWQRINAISHELQDEEQQAGLTPHRTPDPTFLAIAFAWSAGDAFADVVESEELSGGDFVRNIKQLIDLLRQLALIAPKPATRRTAAAAAESLFRGVIASSSTVSVVADEDLPAELVHDDSPG